MVIPGDIKGLAECPVHKSQPTGAITTILLSLHNNIMGLGLLTSEGHMDNGQMLNPSLLP